MAQTEFLKLKQEVEALNSEAILSKEQRKALFWQSHLRAQELNVEFSVLLSDLEPELASDTIGPHGHTRTCYELAWKKDGKQFSFFVTNIKANKTLTLAKCPEFLLAIIIPQMDHYLQRLNQFLADNASYDEEYAQDSEDP